MRKLCFLMLSAGVGASVATAAQAQYYGSGYNDYARQTELYNQQRDLEYQQDKMRERQNEMELRQRMREANPRGY